MARVEIPVTQIPVGGVAAPAQTDGSVENHYVGGNDGNLFIEAANSSGTETATVTIHATAHVDDVPVENEVISVAKSGTSLIAIPEPQVVNQSNGDVYVDVAPHENVKLRAYRL